MRDDMRGTYVTALKSLIITDITPGKGARISDNLYVTNDKATIKRVLLPTYMPIIGVLEWKFIETAKTIIWGDINFDGAKDPVEVVNDQNFEIHAFLQSLWLFVDNSVDTELGFLLYKRSGMPTASSNYLDIGITNSQGKTSEISLSRNELRTIRQFYRNHFRRDSSGSAPVTKVVRTNDRISRALYHLQAARTTSDVAMKVVQFCTAFETLFATSQAEIAHQLSERVAWFLEETADGRFQVYRDMKRIYTVRSRVTHGSGVPESGLKDITSLSRNCDELLRRTITKLFEDTTLYSIFHSGAGLDDYLTKLVLGVTSNGTKALTDRGDAPNE